MLCFCTLIGSSKAYQIASFDGSQSKRDISQVIWPDIGQCLEVVPAPKRSLEPPSHGINGIRQDGVSDLVEAIVVAIVRHRIFSEKGIWLCFGNVIYSMNKQFFLGIRDAVCSRHLMYGKGKKIAQWINRLLLDLVWIQRGNPSQACKKRVDQGKLAVRHADRCFFRGKTERAQRKAINIIEESKV